MAENIKLVESLLESVNEYGKVSYELVKLKALDKTSDVVSSFISHSFVVVLIASFTLFFNLGIALWLGEIFGNISYGFFAVAAFYIISALLIHFFLHNWFKRIAGNYFIQKVLK
jgi:hypothetical protein